ncbi:hypothetical protein [Variovorax saccharolyticus]|uniref:hypothetical protein n=1 Tax=Variovorax saccharolyticus TaxID=3053516 RepID=UPI0025773A0F|nr:MULTISPECIES: hypothetical protein [unclassified Variovorax]MDM0022382.1 hypothetical protein [Variovorax sp. J22R187]MDM0029038.1 hypothetical protein [Variovorax sp. J31P216]
MRHRLFDARQLGFDKYGKAEVGEKVGHSDQQELKDKRLDAKVFRRAGEGR